MPCFVSTNAKRLSILRHSVYLTPCPMPSAPSRPQNIDCFPVVRLLVHADEVSAEATEAPVQEAAAELAASEPAVTADASEPSIRDVAADALEPLTSEKKAPEPVVTAAAAANSEADAVDELPTVAAGQEDVGDVDADADADTGESCVHAGSFVWFV